MKGVREHFGNAQVVFDKFHIIQEANEGVEAVRRLETQQDEFKAAELAKSFGFTGYGLREVTVSSSDQGFVPRQRYAQAPMAAANLPVPVEAGKSAVTVTLSGSVQLS